jgi:hypothetical protein
MDSDGQGVQALKVLVASAEPDGGRLAEEVAQRSRLMGTAAEKRSIEREWRC